MRPVVVALLVCFVLGACGGGADERPSGAPASTTTVQLDIALRDELVSMVDRDQQQRLGRARPTRPTTTARRG